jgi:hypothetical protein
MKTLLGHAAKLWCSGGRRVKKPFPQYQSLRGSSFLALEMAYFKEG